jgi:hypothetical protein
MTVTVDAALVEDRDDDLSVFVETSRTEAAYAALAAASPRLGLVTFDGHEYADVDAWSAADTASGGSFDTTNANFVFDVERRAAGVFVLLDTKCTTTAAMGRTAVAIVREELARQGVDEARLRPVRLDELV